MALRDRSRHFGPPDATRLRRLEVPGSNPGAPTRVPRSRERTTAKKYRFFVRVSLSATTPARILIVDDDRHVRALVRRLLERAGYVCATAENGVKAHELLAVQSFELLVCDLQMPGESGFDVISHVRATYPDTAAIMVTGVDDEQLAGQALALGAYGYIVKPFSSTDLSVQVQNALRRRQLEIAQRHERERLELMVEERTGELCRAVDDLKRSEEQTVRRLAAAVEARDHETAEHIERVGDYSALVAGWLGLSPEHCELIRRSSTLHDVGKIGVADEILLKPGPLTPAERIAMQRHAKIGYDILGGSELDLLELAATIAWTHHERVDGTGYPRGLAGSEIPLEGRIVAVVDVYDALTSDRPYRPALAHENALALMCTGKGTQFDAIVLDAFLRALEETTTGSVRHQAVA
jgi:putative two-component system response regulator